MRGVMDKTNNKIVKMRGVMDETNREMFPFFSAEGNLEGCDARSLVPEGQAGMRQMAQ